MALELINWAKDHEEDDIDESGCVKTRKKRTKVEHEYLSAPPFAKMWDGRKWICEAKNHYQQYVCKTPGIKCRCERIVYVLHRCGDVVFATMCIWLTSQRAYKYAIEVNFRKF